MKPWFADTFYFLALLNPADEHHFRVRKITQRGRRNLVTTQFVFAEVGDALAPPRLRPLFVTLLASAALSRRLEVIAASPEWFERGAQLYAARPDKSWSLTDCISFEVMRERGIREALTGDHHFEQAGFVALLK